MSPIFNVSINGYLVSDIKGNASKELLECPIMQYDCIKNREDIVVIIAVLENIGNEISNTLHGIGIYNQVILTFESDEWCELRGQYLLKILSIIEFKYERWNIV